MVEIKSYTFSIVLCIITMLCWGSWSNTQKLVQKSWRFELYYWDFIIGLLFAAVVAAFTVGSLGDGGRSFLVDLSQADTKSILYAMAGGALWNLGNLLLVAAIAYAGMSVAFPIGGGIAWIAGIGVNVVVEILDTGKTAGDPLFLLVGSIIIIIAIILSAISYNKMAKEKKKKSIKGILLSVAAGIVIASYYGIMVRSLDNQMVHGGAGNLTPYSAIFFLAIGVVISTIPLNALFMKFPVQGEPVHIREYFKERNIRTHFAGILGGVIWTIGIIASFMSLGVASPAISYALGNAAPVVASIWGIFVWKEFKGASKNVNTILVLMFVSYVIGLALIVLAKN